MKKILIIGGSGFIGRHLVKKCLSDGYNVTVYDLNVEKNRISNVFYVQKDLKDIGEEIKNYELIFDLAGTTDNYAISDGKPFRDIEANCTGTLSLLEACRKYNPKVKIVYSSTFFVNGHAQDLPVSVDETPEPLGLYGATKLCAEHFCKIYNNLFDMNICIARFCNVYGPGEPGLNKKKAAFNYLIRQAVLGNDIQMYSDGSHYRDYIYISDVANACFTIAEKGTPSQIYYVGNGQFVKFKVLMEIISKYTKVNINSIDPPEFHDRVGIRDFVCDNSNLKNIGWKSEISNEEGIQQTIEYYKKMEGIE